MFQRLARVVVYNPWKVIAVWLLATIAIVAFAPALADVTARDQSNFLPSSYESVQALNLAKQAFRQANDTRATVVVKRADEQPLRQADQAKVGELAAKIEAAAIERVTGVQTGPQALSPNKKVQLVSVGLQGVGDDPRLLEAVKQVRTQARPVLDGTDLRMAVTGDAAMFVDNESAFNNAFLIVGVATVLLIIVLLALMY